MILHVMQPRHRTASRPVTGSAWSRDKQSWNEIGSSTKYWLLSIVQERKTTEEAALLTIWGMHPVPLLRNEADPIDQPAEALQPSNQRWYSCLVPTNRTLACAPFNSSVNISCHGPKKCRGQKLEIELKLWLSIDSMNEKKYSHSIAQDPVDGRASHEAEGWWDFDLLCCTHHTCNRIDSCE